MYSLYWIIAENKILQENKKQFKNLKIVFLDERLSLIPFSENFIEEINEKYKASVDEYEPFFPDLPEEIKDWIILMSIYWKIVYVCSYFHWGTWFQMVKAFENKKEILDLDDSSNAINKSLKLLWVEKQKWFIDEFATIGLWRFRSVDEWWEDEK